MLSEVFVFFESWELFEAPTLTGTIVGAMLGMLGVYIVLRRMIFLSAAISQGAGFGVALTLFVGLTIFQLDSVYIPTIGALLITILSFFLIMSYSEKSKKTEDAVLGFLFLFFSAAILILGTKIQEEIHEIDSLLYGTAVAVLPEDFSLIIEAACFVFFIHIIGWRGFLAISFQRQSAQIRGLPVKTLDVILLGTMAIAISTSTKVIGSLPTFAFSILPALAATRVTPNLATSLIIATLLGAISGFLGYLFAFILDFPVGASQTMVAVFIVVLSSFSKTIYRITRSA